MSFKYKMLLQTTALLLVFNLSCSYIFAFEGNADGSADTLKPKEFIAGILNAFDIQSVKVNGNLAQDGMTILSGTEVATGSSGKAFVKLYQLGNVEIAPESSVRLVFEAQKVDVQILSGHAVLTTFKGVEGKWIDANGRVATTDPTLEISVVGNKETVSAGASAPAVTAGSGVFFGTGMWGTMGIAAGSVMTWMTVANANNDSQRPVSSVQP